MKSSRCITIAICGGSGSGKSTSCDFITKRFPGLVTVVHADDFYKHVRYYPTFHGIKNFDHPSSLNLHRLADVVHTLQRGRDVATFTWVETITKKGVIFKRHPLMLQAKPILLVEGLFVLSTQELRQSYDYRYFLQQSEQLRVRRRAQTRVSTRYIRRVLLPMHLRHVEPMQRWATTIFVRHKTPAEVTSKIIFVIRQHRRQA